MVVGSGQVRVRPAIDLLGLKTNLSMAQVRGNSVARVDHLCDDTCEDWKTVAAPS
jgi:hypothetical protein